MIWSRYLVCFSFDDGPAPGEAAWEAATAYWEGHRFRCARADEAQLVGRRGSWLGNLTSFDMRRLMCDLDLRREADGRWQVRLLVEGRFQHLTEWSFAELALEQILFRRAVLALPPLPYLEQLRAGSRRAGVAWSLTFTVLGRRLPKFWQQVIRELAAPHEPPTVERIPARRAG